MKTRIYAWLLKKCFRHFIKQGNAEHVVGFPTVYKTLTDVHQEVFFEDNIPTTEAFIHECLHKVMA